MVDLHDEIDKIDGVDERREDVVECVKGCVFEDNDVHVEETEENHDEFPCFGGLQKIYFFIEVRF